jgi:hypothetical protein
MYKETPHGFPLVPEILEAILLQLPIQYLLVNAQRVSHTWKTAIESSSLLQQALFFQPSSTKLQIFNPLLEKAFPPWFREKPEHNVLRGPKLVAALPWGGDTDAQKVFMCADASWRKMLPCQPAKKALKVVGKKNIREGVFEINGVKRFEDGIRMGTIYDLGMDACWVYVGSFWLQWDVPAEKERNEGADLEAGGGRIESENEEQKKEMENEEKSVDEETLTVFTERSWFKRSPDYGPPEVGEEFRSKEYKEVGITLREERRGLEWHGGYGRPPKGGWQIK